MTRSLDHECACRLAHKYARRQHPHFGIMPVIQAQCASILVPHDHRHIRSHAGVLATKPGVSPGADRPVQRGVGRRSRQPGCQSDRRSVDALASRRRSQNVAVMGDGSTRWIAGYSGAGRCRLPSLRTAWCAPSLEAQGHVDELRRVRMQGPVPDQFNLVVMDMDATVAFYRKLGLTIPDTDPQWQHHHRTAAVEGGIDLDLDSSAFTRHWNHGWRGGMGVLGFKVNSRERVDEIYADLAAAG